ncbi:HEAT repeat domain-containing protein [Nocardia terrae]|uniref:HEAT repeat domain-containing protein n=1 Tax=Nocardia terrae TaxID=2675851 RepID=UPI0012FC6315|nr:HEAT repeat domain-containing protein [Nocardia terrae]
MHAFEGSPLTLLPRLGFTAAALVDATMALPRDDRMRIILWLRPQGIEDFVPVLIAAVQDPDEHIRMTAIEYLGYWGDRSDVRECFERLVNSGEHRELQPYAGMALYSIEEDWARRLHQRMMHG